MKGHVSIPSQDCILIDSGGSEANQGNCESEQLAPLPRFVIGAVGVKLRSVTSCHAEEHELSNLKLHH
jgi:hypothetical protein